MPQMSRRKFMALTGLGVVSLTLGGLVWRVASVWWHQPAARGFEVLSAQEVLISDAIAEALFPGDGAGAPSGVEVGLTRKLDHMLATTLAGDSADLLRVLLHAVDEGAAVGGGWTRLHLLTLPERVAALQAWDASFVATRRHAFGALKIMYAMCYCEDPAVLQALGVQYTCGSVA